jgi:hypothetical protein
MDYKRAYDKICEKANSENRVKGQGTYYEAHHIIPACLGGQGKTSQWRTHPNIVLLTSKEHYICHLLLCHIYPENSKLAFAFWAMCNQKNPKQKDRYTPTGKIYEYARELNSFYASITQKNVSRDPEAQRRGVETRKKNGSYIQTAEKKLINSIANKGRKKSKYKKREKFLCNYCNRFIDISYYKNRHGEKCKSYDK